MPRPKDIRPLLFLGALLALILLSFIPLRNAGFISFDDPDYVTENVTVQRGLSVDGLRWAFTTGHSSNWHPLTWLAHMLDWQLFGNHPSAHHLSNLFLHAANAVVIFLLFRKMTGAFWRSGMVAALFALHPLHVESVAWISEKKDVLSTFFGLLSMWFYTQFAIGNGRSAADQTGSASGRNLKAKTPYALALLFFAAALMSKPMLVTLPFVFLLLDFWPLKRIPSAQSWFTTGKGLFLEKIPFFLLCIASSLVTFFVQQSGGAVRTLTEFSLSHRLANALISYVIYLRKTFWPSDLAIFYPPMDFSFLQLAGAALLLAGISAAAIHLRRARPYILMGWLWFLGTLLPVIGIIQVGEQSLADRYSYLPLVGIFTALIWGIDDLCAREKYKSIAFAGGVIATGVCATLTFFQASYWRNNQTLFGHAISVTDKNYLAHNHLATEFLRQNEETKAKEHLILAVKYRPQFSDARVNLGFLLAKEGNLAEAKIHFEEALRSAPAFDKAHFNLATLLKSQGNLTEAAKHYAAVIDLDPKNADAHNGLAFILAQTGDMKHAAEQFSESVKSRPDDGVAHFNLATALLNLGQTNAAIEHYAAAIRAQPDLEQARQQLDLLTGKSVRTTTSNPGAEK